MQIVMTKPKQDLGDLVMAQMKKLGVTTMPRNYEVFYTAMSGSNPALAKDLKELGLSPLQHEIDQVANNHFPERTEANVVSRAQRQLTKQIGDLQNITSHEVEEIRQLTNDMTTMSRSLGSEEITAEKAFEALGKLISAAQLRTEGSEAVMREYVAQGVKLAQTQRELEDARRLAVTDQTTGALNRRAFDDALNAIYDSKDYFQYSLVILDIDHFKKINDKFGHPAGDQILKLVANTIKTNLRPDVPLFRFGGEEFAFVLKNVDAEIVMKIAERVRRGVEEQGLTDRKTGGKVSVTISLGICMADRAESATELLQKADEALYASKNKPGGRNCSTDWATLEGRLDNTGGRFGMYRQVSPRI